MSKTAFMFPGQGAQYIGMGKEFHDSCDKSREAFNMASEAVSLDLKQLCFEENDKINITEYTQIAMFAAEAAILAAVTEQGIQSDVNVGLSLGEYGALLASRIIEYEDLCRIVRKRGIFMEKEVPAGIGAMSAVLGMDSEAIEKCLAQVDGIVQVANYNCPGQIVISGEAKAVKEAGDKLTAAGARRVVPLNVSGPFHSGLLEGAGSKLAEELKGIHVNEIKTPYVANVTAQYVVDSNDVRELLKRQVYSPVRFEQSVRYMLEQGVDTFIEIGPGRTLSGFVKKIDREAKVYNIEKPQDLEKLQAAEGK